MGRLIFIAVVVVAVVWLLKRAMAGPRAAAPPPESGEQKGDLVSCAHCSVNLPKSEARSVEGRLYCSEEHSRLGPREG